MANGRAPIVGHLLTEGKVALQMYQAFDDPGKSVVARVRGVGGCGDCLREVGRDFFQGGAKLDSVSP